MKICGAVAEMDYGQVEVERMDKLVEKNLMNMNVLEISDNLQHNCSAGQRRKCLENG